MAHDASGHERLAAELVAAIGRAGEIDLTSLIETVDGDPAAVFACVRRLEREGAVDSPEPGVYRLTESGTERAADRGVELPAASGGNGEPTGDPASGRGDTVGDVTGIDGTGR